MEFRIIYFILASVDQISVGLARAAILLLLLGNVLLFFFQESSFLHLCPCFLSQIDSIIGLQGWLGVLIWPTRIHCDHFMGRYVNNVSLTTWPMGLLLELLGGVVLQLPVVVFSIIGNILPKNKVKMEKRDASLMTKVKLPHLPMFNVTFTDLPSYTM